MGGISSTGGGIRCCVRGVGRRIRSGVFELFDLVGCRINSRLHRLLGGVDHAVGLFLGRIDCRLRLVGCVFLRTRLSIFRRGCHLFDLNRLWSVFGRLRW